MQRTAPTVDAYRCRAIALVKQAEIELRVGRLNIHQVLAWFLAHHFTWAPATIRQYRAALTQFVNDAIEAKLLDPSKGRLVAEKLRGQIDKDGRQIAPRARSNSTKPKKRKYLSPRQADQIIERLYSRRTKAAHLGRLIVKAGSEIGLRACEWPTVEVHDAVCQVRNAKHTNYRANGKTRQISIAPHPEGTELLATIYEVAKAIPRDIPWKNMERRLNYVLRRVSLDIGLKVPVSLSTLRQVAIGRWKCVFDPDEVAALAGHASNATAVEHYGRRRSGRKWPPTLIRPCPPQLAIRDKFRRYERPSSFTLH